MKILQVIDTLNAGGAERVFVNMCNLLYEKNIDVTPLLLLDDRGDLNADLLVPKIVLKRKSKWDLRAMYRCSQLLRDFDIIHCHLRHVYAYITFVDLLFVCRSKIIFHDHFGTIDMNQNVPFLFKSLFRPRYYIGVSASLTQWAIKNLSIADKNVFLLSNIIRKATGAQMPDKDLDLILVSNIKPVKNNLFAIELAKSLNRKLLLVGKIQDDKYFARIKSVLDKNGSINATTNNAQAIASRAIMGLHTSKSETGPLVLIEYLAQGLPFLAYETGEVAKILKPYFPAYFIDNFDLEQWKDRVNLLMQSTPAIDKMNAVFEQHFGESQYVNKLLNIYKCISDY